MCSTPTAGALKWSEQPRHLEHPLVDYHDVSCERHVPNDYRAEADDSQTVQSGMMQKRT
jgi:hypothetical protein